MNNKATEFSRFSAFNQPTRPMVDSAVEAMDTREALLDRLRRIKFKWDLNLPLSLEDRNGWRTLFNGPIPEDVRIARDKLDRALRFLASD